ncbi:MAG TPA: NADH-quinone oxidoreductase subunit L [Kineosporiaceae bacterium]|nr:NADH-quinone oxidoreductase subunit L [Kineosporiaceae bacterium]
MIESAALLTIVLPTVAAVLGLVMGGRSRPWAGDWAVLGSLGALIAAVLELVQVLRQAPVTSIGFLGRAELGTFSIGLDLRADQLSASIAVAVGLVAFCVQVYSTAYLSGTGTPEAPTRYPAYAATVSLFTAAMMLVIHSADLVLLLIGWEAMGLASYLLVGHHSERASARAAAMKAFLVTRIGDLGVLLAVVVLLADARTTSIAQLTAAATSGELGHATLLTAGLLLLAGVAGKSAQFPLHTWLPDAMEGPTPVSALIHAATMVAAGVFLVARLLPLYLAVPGALQVAAVIAAISMVGAALAAIAQDDLKRLLAYSTISQVAYMLAGVAVSSGPDGSGPGIFHLLSHAAFKALLFLTAGCVIHLVGSTMLADMGGLLRTHRALAVLFGIGLAGLAGVPPLGGFWSKEAVLTAAEEAAHAGSWTGWVVLLTGLGTSLLTGIYAGRAWSIVALGSAAKALPAHGDAETEEPHETLAPGQDAALHATGPEHQHRLPAAMMLPLYLLAVPTLGFGLVLIDPPELLGAVHVDLVTGVTGAMLSLAGLGWALSAPRLGAPDIAIALPVGARAMLRDGFRVDAVQHALIVRPALGLARGVKSADWGVIDAYVRAIPPTLRVGGNLLRRAQTGLATAYAAWLVIGAVVIAIAGVGLS